MEKLMLEAGIKQVGRATSSGRSLVTLKKKDKVKSLEYVATTVVCGATNGTEKTQYQSKKNGLLLACVKTLAETAYQQLFSSLTTLRNPYRPIFRNAI
jgi:UDP-N-acetylglucosamine pyrophosphorylase